MAAAVGAKALVDRSGKKALERPVAHMSTDSLILAELMNDPDGAGQPHCAKRQPCDRGRG